MKTETDNPDGCKISVVVAEDSRHIRELLRNYIKILPGMDFLGAAADGCKALEIVAARHPRLLLMDLNMPGINGLQALALIREYHPSTRVFIVSAEDSEAMKETCLAQGADRFISKFALHDELNSAIAEVFPEAMLASRKNRSTARGKGHDSRLPATPSLAALNGPE